MGWVAWIAGFILITLSLFAGRVAKEYETEGKPNHEMGVMLFGLTLAVIGALLWRAA